MFIAKLTFQRLDCGRACEEYWEFHLESSYVKL